MYISYKDMINELIREIDGYENSIIGHMNTMLSAQSPDIVDANFATINHTLVSLWRTRKALLKALDEEKEAKTKSGAIYGKAALEAWKEEEEDESCIRDP